MCVHKGFTVHVSMTVTKTDDEGWPQQGVKMHAKLLTHDNRASGLGGAHCEVSLVSFSNAKTLDLVLG